MSDLITENMQALCRICLVQNSNLTPLRNYLNQKTLFETLESVFSIQIIKEEKYPQCICQNCLNTLKLSYELTATFNSSQQRLEEFFRGDSLKLEKTTENDGFSTVFEPSLSIKDEKFIVVENDCHDEAGEVSDASSDFSAEIAKLLNKSAKDEKLSGSKQKLVVAGHLCSICKKPYLSEAGLRKHMETIHESKTVKTESLRDLCIKHNGVCPICSKKFASESGFKNHAAICMRNGVLCQKCGHLSMSRYQAQRHEQKHIGKVHECDICHKKFYSNEYLNQHKINHTFKREHLCIVCGNIYLHPKALILHMKKHEEWKHICSYCNKKFYKKTSLNSHLRIHTGEKPYPCSFPNCGKRFSSSRQRQKHEYTHTGYKPFVCKYCEKKFASKYHLNMHYLTHKGSFECDICSKTFIEFEFMKLHVEKIHNKTKEDGVVVN